MTGKRLYWVLAIVAIAALIAFVCRQFVRHERAQLISGKSVRYWLDNLPPEAHNALLPADNPLAQAGPEVIPSLIDAIETGYAARDFINRHRRQFPHFLHKYLPAQTSYGYLIRQA